MFSWDTERYIPGVLVLIKAVVGRPALPRCPAPLCASGDKRFFFLLPPLAMVFCLMVSSLPSWYGSSSVTFVRTPSDVHTKLKTN